MDPQKFDEMKTRRMDWMVRFVWPEIERRLADGVAPKQIAKELAEEGYWGFTCQRMCLPDMYYIWQEVTKRQRKPNCSPDDPYISANQEPEVQGQI